MTTLARGRCGLATWRVDAVKGGYEAVATVNLLHGGTVSARAFGTQSGGLARTACRDLHARLIDKARDAAEAAESMEAAYGPR